MRGRERYRDRERNRYKNKRQFCVCNVVSSVVDALISERQLMTTVTAYVMWKVSDTTLTKTKTEVSPPMVEK